MRSRGALAMMGVAGLALGVDGAAAQVADWAAPASGQWAAAGSWAPAAVPNGAGFTANISVGGVYGVTLGAISPSVGLLNLSNTQATLGIDNAQTLTVNGMTNNGVITVNFNNGGSATSLLAGAPAVAFNGSGSLVLNATSGVAVRANLSYTNAANVITNGGTHVIRGAGNVQANLVNNATVRADVPGLDLVLLDQPKTNNAAMRGEGGGRLVLSNATLTQSASGTLFANGGTVRIESGTINGGQFGAQAGSAFELSGGSTLRNAAATLTLPTSRSASLLNAASVAIEGILVNNGTLTVNSNSGGSVTSLNAAATNTRFNGSGTLLLNATADVPVRAVLGSTAATSVLTNTANHTIRGAGSLTAALSNLGTVTADVVGSRMQLSGNAKSNSGTMRATGGALLDMTGFTLTQTGAGVVRGDSGTVQLTGGMTLAGGRIETVGTGAVEVNGTATIEESSIALTNAGTLSVLNAATLTARESITNNGDIVINSNSGGSVTTLAVPAGETTTLAGTGTLTLNATSSVPIRARVQTGAGGSLTNAAGHTIRGRGQLDASITNLGTISANNLNEPMEVAGAGITNSGLVRSIDGGVLRILTTLNQQPAGVLRSGQGRVELSTGSIISGGTLESGSGGTFEVVGSPARITDAFGPTLLTGVINVQNALDLRITGTLDNDGTIVVNSNGGGSVTRVTTGSAVAMLDGTGEVVLNAVGGVPTRAQILSTTLGDTLVNGPAHTIRGGGDVNAGLDNQGVVSADSPATSLDLTGAGKSNSGLMQATAGSVLRVLTPVTQTGTGVIRADGGMVQLAAAAAQISGGSLESINGGVFEVTSSGGDLTNAPAGPVTSTARINIPSATSIDVIGEFINNGTVVVNSNSGGSVTNLRLSSPNATMNGTGRVVLNATLGVAVRAQLTRETGSDTLVNGVGHTIEGTGNIVVPLTNNGRLSPGSDLAGAGEISDLFAVSVPVSFGDNAELDVQVAGTAVGQYDRLLNVSDTVSVDGTLRVRHAGAFTSAPFGTQIPVVQASSVTGAFDEVVGDALPEPLVWRAIYTPTQVRALVSCKGDLTGDGTLDSGDLATFVSLFLASDLLADITGDGQVDSGDLGLFISIFVGGC